MIDTGLILFLIAFAMIPIGYYKGFLHNKSYYSRLIILCVIIIAIFTLTALFINRYLFELL